tara:strand:+ start:646 stop:828 length:183 start_codon:yes stop_codon:yes gene_type:complete
MSNKSHIRTSYNQVAPQMSKVDVDVLMRRVSDKEKKVKFQNRVILVSAIVSLGILSYLSV